jgi:probable rRNA maturation factor
VSAPARRTRPGPAPLDEARLETELSLESPLWAAVPGVEDGVCAAAEAAFAAMPDRPALAEVSIALVDDAAIRDLNRAWRGKDQPTNVLSFPAPPVAIPGAPVLLGDIAVAFETTAAEAAAEGKTIADHLAHLVVHGMLHLFGHDHIEAGEAEQMETIERDILATLGIADPYAGRDID